MRTFPVITVIVCLAGIQINGLKYEKGDLYAAESGQRIYRSYGSGLHHGGNSIYSNSGRYGGFGKGQGFGSSNYGSGGNYNSGFGYANGLSHGGSLFGSKINTRGGKGKFGHNRGYLTGLSSGFGQGLNDYDFVSSPQTGQGHGPNNGAQIGQGHGHNNGYDQHFNDEGNESVGSPYQGYRNNGGYGPGHLQGRNDLLGSTHDGSFNDHEGQGAECDGCVGSSQSGYTQGRTPSGYVHRYSGGIGARSTQPDDEVDESDDSDEPTQQNEPNDGNDDVGAPPPVPHEAPKEERTHGPVAPGPGYPYTYPSAPPHGRCGQNLLISCNPTSQVVPCSGHSAHGPQY